MHTTFQHITTAKHNSRYCSACSDNQWHYYCYYPSQGISDTRSISCAIHHYSWFGSNRFSFPFHSFIYRKWTMLVAIQRAAKLLFIAHNQYPFTLLPPSHTLSLCLGYTLCAHCTNLQIDHWKNMLAFFEWNKNQTSDCLWFIILFTSRCICFLSLSCPCEVFYSSFQAPSQISFHLHYSYESLALSISRSFRNFFAWLFILKKQFKQHKKIHWSCLYSTVSGFSIGCKNNQRFEPNGSIESDSLFHYMETAQLKYVQCIFSIKKASRVINSCGWILFERNGSIFHL